MKTPNTSLFASAITTISRAMLFVLIASCIIIFIPQPAWPFELLNHFRPHYFGMVVICLLIGIFMKRPLFSATAMLCLLINGAIIFPYYTNHKLPFTEYNSTSESVPFSALSSSLPEITLLLSNVNSNNQNYHQLLELIAIEQPDIVDVQEFTPTWQNQLQSLEQQYPYHHLVAEQGQFGIALYSRYPLSHTKTELMGKAALPSITTNIELHEGNLALVASHPLPPINKQLFHLRNDQLHQLADKMLTLDSPKLLIGDLNSTPWSDHFASLLTHSGLVDLRKGAGIIPTWPSQINGLGIPIDHMLASPDIATVSIKTGPDIGSDHRPLVAKIKINI